MALATISGFALTKLKQKLGLNTESHWLDTVETNVATTSSALTMAYPYVIPIGDTVNSRTGRSVRVTSYKVRGRIQANTAATSGCLVRILFVKWKDIRGRSTGLIGSDFLDDPARITTQYNMGDTADATGYTVLYDKTFSISINGQDGDTHQFNFIYKAPNFHLQWESTDTTGAQASLMSDTVRGYIYTSEAGANTPNYWCDHRCRFVDN